MKSSSDCDEAAGPVDRKTLLREFDAAYDLYRDKYYERAKVALLRVMARAQCSGIRSMHLEWALAITLDAIGDYEGAFRHVSAAQALDPLDLQAEHSLRVIADHARRRLLHAEEQGLDGEVEGLYGVLLRYGEADAESHLVAGRFLAKSGRPAEARQIFAAVTTLHPTSRSAWQGLEAAARAIGDDEAAARAKLEAELCPTGGAVAEAGKARA